MDTHWTASSNPEDESTTFNPLESDRNIELFSNVPVVVNGDLIYGVFALKAAHKKL